LRKAGNETKTWISRERVLGKVGQFTLRIRGGGREKRAWIVLKSEVRSEIGGGRTDGGRQGSKALRPGTSSQ